MTAARYPAASAASALSPQRKGLIAKVHIAKVQLGLSDDDYQAVLLRVAGRASAKDCSDAELHDVVKAFERQGFTTKARTGPRKPADHPMARKARAMWISLHHLSAIANPAEEALEAFARRQLGVDQLQWANQSQSDSLIEALKAIARRHGWDQDLAGVKVKAKVLVLKRALVEAILAKLVAAELVPANWSLDRAAYELAGIEIALFAATTEELDRVAKAFGTALRKAPRP